MYDIIIDRLTALTAPSPDVNAAISEAVYPWLACCPRDDHGDEPGWIAKDGRVRCLDYTGSLEDALTLVPTHLTVSLIIRAGETFASIRTGSILDPNTKEWNAFSKTSAVAVTTAVMNLMKDTNHGQITPG